MKSSVKFDLNGQNEAVITARIVLTEDVRDKVAKSFTEKLGHESCLATVFFEKQGNLGDLQTIGHTIVSPGSGERYQDIVIRPLDCMDQSMVHNMGGVQLHNVLVAVIAEKMFRESKGKPEIYNFSGNSMEGIKNTIKFTKEDVINIKKQIDEIVSDLTTAYKRGWSKNNV